MARFLVLMFLATLALCAVALISALSAEPGEVRRLPRSLWTGVILLLPVVGPVLYFWLGRPERAVDPWPVAVAEPRRRPLAPDDDPEFLSRLRRDGRTTEDRPPTDG
jgi:hypothetical protein